MKPESEKKEEKSSGQSNKGLESRPIAERIRSITHEFNNLLSVILGNNELIMVNSDKLSLSYECSKEIKTAGLKVLDLVNELSALSRQDDSRFPASPGKPEGSVADTTTAPAVQSGDEDFPGEPGKKNYLKETHRKALDRKDSPGRCGCLLLIEDDSQLRKLFAMKLSRQGYKVLEARDGKEGVALFSEAQPDLVITDLIMPEKEGIETIIEIRRYDPDAKIIAVSGGGRNHPDDYLEVAKALGANTTFSKPVNWPDLLRTIDELLN